FSHSVPTISRTRSTSSASCPARSPVIRSQRGGCPSITVVHTTEVIYPRAAAVSAFDTSQVDHSHRRWATQCHTFTHRSTFEWRSRSTARYRNCGNELFHLCSLRWEHTGST